MTPERRADLERLVELRPDLDDIRHRARLACVVNPLLWLAVHGVPLNTYLATIDELDRLCARAETELAAERMERA